MIPTIPREQVIGKYFWLWPLFCLQAGLLNSGGFLASHSFVTHVTGFGTRVGVELSQGNIFLGLEMLLIPACFIAGNMAAGYFTEVRPIRGKAPRAQVPLILLSVLLGLISLGGVIDVFGSFGEPLILQRDFALLGLLCFASGLQNGTITSMTGGVVRTTHLTGISTDLGLNATRILARKDESDRRWFRLRLMKLCFFALGAALGTLLFIKLEYLGFLLPAVLNLVLVLRLRAGVVGTDIVLDVNAVGNSTVKA